MIADNGLTEIATWDDRLLAEQLKELSLSGIDFDIEVAGFELAEIDLRIAALDEMAEQGDDPADVVPKLRERAPVSRIGDVWVLGRDRVMCGSSRQVLQKVFTSGRSRAASMRTISCM